MHATALFVEIIIKSASSHHARLATITLKTQDLKDVHKVLLSVLRLILNRAHCLKQAIEVADHATAGRTLDVRVHFNFFVYYRSKQSILAI